MRGEPILNIFEWGQQRVLAIYDCILFHSCFSIQFVSPPVYGDVVHASLVFHSPSLGAFCSNVFPSWLRFIGSNINEAIAHGVPDCSIPLIFTLAASLTDLHQLSPLVSKIGTAAWICNIHFHSRSMCRAFTCLYVLSCLLQHEFGMLTHLSFVLGLLLLLLRAPSLTLVICMDCIRKGWQAEHYYSHHSFLCLIFAPVLLPPLGISLLIKTDGGRANLDQEGFRETLGKARVFALPERPRCRRARCLAAAARTTSTSVRTGSSTSTSTGTSTSTSTATSISAFPSCMRCRPMSHTRSEILRQRRREEREEKEGRGGTWGTTPPPHTDSTTTQHNTRGRGESERRAMTSSKRTKRQGVGAPPPEQSQQICNVELVSYSLGRKGTATWKHS